MDARNRGRRHRPPSKDRYDRTHPVLGTRVSRKEYDAVKEFLSETGSSFAKFIRIALKRQRANYDEAMQEGFDQGYEQGYAEAKERYEVTHDCANCGGTLSIVGDNAKQSAGRYMEQHLWGHKECPE